MIIDLSIADIKNLLGDLIIRTPIDDSFILRTIKPLPKATIADLAIVFDRGQESVFDQITQKEIAETKASVIMLSSDIQLNGREFIVKDTISALEKIISFCKKKPTTQCPSSITTSALIDTSAVIGTNVSIGENSIVGAHVFLGNNVTIGNNVILAPGVKVLDQCIIGNNSIIQAGTIIGSDGFGYQITKKGMRKIPHIGIVFIGNDVEIGANCSIDRSCLDQTIIEDGVKIDNNVHIAHNVIVGMGSAILAQTGIAGSVIIGKGCQIGGQVAIKDHVKIGNFVKIVSKSAVMHNIADNEIVAGIPAIAFSKWKRTIVLLQKLPEYIAQYKKNVHIKKPSCIKRLLTHLFNF